MDEWLNEALTDEAKQNKDFDPKSGIALANAEGGAELPIIGSEHLQLAGIALSVSLGLSAKDDLHRSK